ncbi:hypothetical protein [Emcibacter sp. SYSU 3D8]|uniref:hypothetical protein n=1 Tax=Emcibacter sp. SYSU 3D8 TaxID=3133969 RepID=UPI0031FE5D39
MTQGITPSAFRSRALLSAAFLGFTLLGMSFAQAQESAPEREAATASQGDDAMRGIEKSDIRRGQTGVGDVDGDGLADPDQVSRTGKFKAGKALAETVKSVGQPSAGGGDQEAPIAPGKVDSGNALNAVSGNDAGSTAQQRIKMKKLKPTEVTLEPMDETDTCPTLPCP